MVVIFGACAVLMQSRWTKIAWSLKKMDQASPVFMKKSRPKHASGGGGAVQYVQST